MPIVRTALAPTYYDASIEDPVTPSMALGTDPGRAVIGFMSIASARSVSAVSVTGGDTLSSVATPVTVDGFKRTAAAGLVTQSGSQTVTYNTDSPGPSENKWGETVAYSGVSSIRSITIVNGAAGTNPSATVTTLAGDKVVLLGISAGAGASLSAAGGATDFDGGLADRVALEKDAVGTSTTINGTWSSNSAWYAAVVVLAPIAGPSGISGNVTADDAVASGALGLALSSVTTLPASRNPGNGSRLASIANVALAVMTDDANLSRLAGSAALNMGSDGRLAFANGVPVPAGTSVIVLTRLPGANGALGVERYITA